MAAWEGGVSAKRERQCQRGRPVESWDQMAASSGCAGGWTEEGRGKARKGSVTRFEEIVFNFQAADSIHERPPVSPHERTMEWVEAPNQGVRLEPCPTGAKAMPLKGVR